MRFDLYLAVPGNWVVRELHEPDVQTWQTFDDYARALRWIETQIQIAESEQLDKERDDAGDK